MSEKSQLESDVSEADVSRETHLDEETPEQVMLNEIMDQAMLQFQDTPMEEAEQETPQGKAPSSPEKETHTSPPVKNKPSSTYIYLAVLFGAAFLMLLLAYFVQQRNNASVLDDLRSTTASREELLEEIQQLEEKNESLQQDNELLNLRLDQVKEEREELKTQLDDYYYSKNEYMMRTALNNELTYLEQFIDSKDWLMAGVIIETSDYLYNEHNVEYLDTKIKPTTSQTVRYFELREKVFDQSGIMVMESFTTTDNKNEYTERPYIGENIFDEQDYETAKDLLSVILYYPNSLSIPATFFDENFTQAGSSLERLNSRAFKPSTVELYQQVMADILAVGAQIELNGELVGIPPDTNSAQSANND